MYIQERYYEFNVHISNVLYIYEEKPPLLMRISVLRTIFKIFRGVRINLKSFRFIINFRGVGWGRGGGSCPFE